MIRPVKNHKNLPNSKQVPTKKTPSRWWFNPSEKYMLVHLDPFLPGVRWSFPKQKKTRLRSPKQRNWDPQPESRIFQQDEFINQTSFQQKGSQKYPHMLKGSRTHRLNKANNYNPQRWVNLSRMVWIGMMKNYRKIGNIRHRNVVNPSFRHTLYLQIMVIASHLRIG